MTKIKVCMLAAAIIFLGILSFISFNLKTSTPLDPLHEVRTFVKNYELIAINETEKGTMVYSVGTTNNGTNMYFVDMVEQSLNGYKWLGGGGHVSRNIGRNKDFVFSAQLLNEEQNINPTLFGVFKDQKISKITAETRNEVSDSTVFDGNGEEETFFVVPFEKNVSKVPYFKFTITYNDGNKIDYVVANDKLSDFQAGKVLYLYEDEGSW